MATLDGHGFSYKECQIAIMVVGNTMFGRKWKIPKEEHCESEDEESTFDADTLPTQKTIRTMLEKLQVYSLKLVGNRVIEANSEGATITHATDSTTRKVVGTFAPSGLHINRNEYLPFPTLPISTETTKNIANLIEVDFKILEAASGHSAELLYGAVDVHMTDSTAHNKGVSSILAKTFNRKDKVGQIFFGSHTVLGFDRSMEKVISLLEERMGLQNIFNSFLLDVDIDHGKKSVSMSTVSWSLSLFGPDNSQKPWNYHKDLLTYMHKHGKSVHLFSLKDARFGALSKSCATMCFHWSDFCSFLETHDYITNKLACLVRDALKLEYVKVVIAVVATMGVQLVSPYHFRTIATTATHSSLKDFFINLHEQLASHHVEEGFFEFKTPEFIAVCQKTYDGVKKYYGSDVLDSVREIANSNMNECVSLANKIIPELGDVLAMQRGKYYDFGDYPKEYPVFNQCSNINNAPVNNLRMESQCGDTDHRLKKKSKLEVFSRGTVLRYSSNLRDSVPSAEFRKMGPVVQILKDIKFNWTKRQLELQSLGLIKKEANLLPVENKKINIL